MKIPIKQWLAEQCALHNRTKGTIYIWLRKGKIKRPEMVRVNRKIIWVVANKRK